MWQDVNNFDIIKFGGYKDIHVIMMIVDMAFVDKERGFGRGTS